LKQEVHAMSLIPWRNKRGDEASPLSAMNTLRSEMDRVFDRMMGALDGPFGGFGSGFPSLDISETDTEVCVRAEVPGVDPKELDVTLSGQTLTLAGEKKESTEHKGENYYHAERRFGSFRRSVQLPAPVDPEKMSAEHKNGVVLIKLRKHQSATPKRISVKTSE
jgi:HSP20 family protein